MRNNYFAIASSLFLAGILLFLNYTGLSNIDTEKVYALVFIFYGIVTVITALHKISRGAIFTAAVIMLTGIIFYISDNYEILNKYDIVLSSVLFVTGGGLLAVFIDNIKETTILILSLVLFAAAFIAVYFQESNSFIKYANNITLILFGYWPLFLILFGIVLLSGRKK